MFEDCPPEERELCCWYEYAREGCRGSPVQPSLFPDPWDNDLFPEWPGKPYLMIPALEREGRLKRLQGGTADYLHSLNLKPPFHTYISPEMAKRYLDTFEVFELSEDATQLRQRHRWPIQEISDAYWVALFGINWQRSDSEIRDDFAAWLREHRPKEFPSPIGDRGAGNYSRRLQNDLKILGAWRLLQFYKDWKDIPAEAAIYEDPSSWMTAHQKAEIRLKFFRP